jgi:hypothetical protein
MLKNLILSGAILVSLAGCSTLSGLLPVVEKPVPILPPIELLGDCPVPALKGDTNADLAELAIDSLESLHGCNADKEGIRKFYEELTNAKPKG